MSLCQVYVLKRCILRLQKTRIQLKIDARKHTSITHDLGHVSNSVFRYSAKLTILQLTMDIFS